MHAIRAQSRISVDTISELIAWPGRTVARVGQGLPRRHLRRRGQLRQRHRQDLQHRPTILDWTTFACRRLGLAVHRRERARGHVERAHPRRARAAAAVLPPHRPGHHSQALDRRPGGQVAEPSEGRGDRAARDGAAALRHHDRHRRLHRQRRRSHNCFARPTHEYLDFNAGRTSSKEIVVKVNVPEVLRAELARPSWKGEHVALGTNTDPYQWVEGRYKLMRGIWEAMRDARNPCSILTKSPLLLRDKDLLLEIAERTTGQRVPVGADARREGLAGDRAAHAAPARAARGGGRAQPGRHPDRHPDRAADARDQRRAGAGRGDRRAGRRRPGRPRSAARRCSCAARRATSSSTGCASTGPTSCERYEELYRRGAYVPSRRERKTLAARLPGRRRKAARTRRRASTAPPRRRPPPSAADAGAETERCSERASAVLKTAGTPAL